MVYRIQFTFIGAIFMYLFFTGCCPIIWGTWRQCGVIWSLTCTQNLHKVELYGLICFMPIMTFTTAWLLWNRMKTIFSHVRQGCKCRRITAWNSRAICLGQNNTMSLEVDRLAPVTIDGITLSRQLLFMGHKMSPTCRIWVQMSKRFTEILKRLKMLQNPV